VAPTCASWEAITTSTSTKPSISATTLPDFQGYNNPGNIILKCHKKYGPHKDVHQNELEDRIAKVCDLNGKTTLDPKIAAIKNFEGIDPVNDGGIYFVFNIVWIPGCRLANEHGDIVDEQMVDFKSVDVALTDSKKKQALNEGSSCEAYLATTYRKCYNGGVGGIVQAGCLTYDFWAGTSARPYNIFQDGPDGQQGWNGTSRNTTYKYNGTEPFLNVSQV
jgi:hypothetical protein